MRLLDRMLAALRSSRRTLGEIADATANTYDPAPVEPVDEGYMREIEATVQRAVRYQDMRQGDCYRATGMLVDIWPHYKQLREERARHG